MSKKRILVQLDTDPMPSVFDRIVAIDTGVDEVLSYGGVTPDDVAGLVHGGMFTRGAADLKSTAFFVGGKNVAAAEAILMAVRKSFVGAVRNSVMLDPNGANTTAAAVAISAARHLDMVNSHALILGGTGPVGQRIALLLASAGAKVAIASRSISRANDAVGEIQKFYSDANVYAIAEHTDAGLLSRNRSFHLIVAAGAAGVRFLEDSEMLQHSSLRVAIDINAVEPTGLGLVDPSDKAKEREHVICYGAYGIGGLKMKIHKSAIVSLFQRNDVMLDAVDIMAIGQQLESTS